MEYMKCLVFGQINSLMAMIVTFTLVSCNVEDGSYEAWGDSYSVRHQSSAKFLAYAAYLNTTDDGKYVTYGRSVSMSMVGDGGVGEKPEQVWATISTRDSVIEIVPKLMTSEAPYTLFSGLDEWFDGSSELVLTDEAIAHISARMRKQGRPPYRIVRDELVNSTSSDLKISTLSGGSTTNTVNVAAGETVVLSNVGLLFKGDQYAIQLASGRKELSGCIVERISSKSYRLDDFISGYRQFRITNLELDWMFSDFAR